MKQNKILTTADICQMHGGLVVAKRHIDYLIKNVIAACDEYDDTSCDDAVFLSQCSFALDNIDIVCEALEFVESSLKTMRAEISPQFNGEEDEA